MNFKTAFIALSVSALSVAGLIGCGNDCDDAADRIAAKAEECKIEGSTATEGGEGAECTEEQGTQAQCSADCFEAAPCGAFDGSDLDALQAFSDCSAKCTAPAAE